MQAKREWMLGAGLFAAAMLTVLMPSGAPLNAKQAAAQSDQPVPAHHNQAATGTLPETMDPAQFENPVVKNAYALSAKVKKVLYQQPCYCHCDRSQGHNSLLDCFTSKHGSLCNICLGEALYSYEQTGKGKTAAQIRDGIVKGEWQSVDPSKYQTYPRKP